jgi:probable F420-dependent oxidoreductase
MKIDCAFAKENDFHNLNDIAEKARHFEQQGFDGLLTAEMAHDPFLPLMIAAQHTKTLEIRTSIAVAFARNPMLLASLAHDLNAYSQGRFTLGIGSQIKPHISKRFSMPWHGPAAQMREMIEAIHAIWDCWYEQKPLAFKGKYYTHTLMTPMFTPANIQFGRPKIAMAAVGPKMTQVASELADGIILHAFNTEKYIREQLLPLIEQGLANSQRTREQFEIAFPMFVVTGDTQEALMQSKETARQQIAFYGSTPAYRPVLDCHGWGELQDELNRLSKLGNWVEMAALISDEILETIAVVGEPEEMSKKIKLRYEDIIDRIALDTTLSADSLQKQFAILKN